MSEPTGRGIFTAIDPRSLSIAHKVKQLLPGLAKKSARWSARAICPICGDIKTIRARMCQPCWKRRKAFARREEKLGRILVMAPIEGPQHGKGRGPMMTGKPHAQPTLKRLVKQADGTWARYER